MNPDHFVGRCAELDLLQEQLHHTRRHGTRLLLISAPSGMGKTALVQRFAGAHYEGGIFARGRGWDNVAAVPYHPLREALLQLPPPTAPDFGQTPSACVDAFLADPPRSPASDLPPGHFFQALGARFQTHAAPVLTVFLDDFQWTDAGTLQWLDYALREMEAAPVLWIGACRSETERNSTALLTRYAQWRQTGRFTHHSLGPLSPAEVEELGDRMLPARQWNRTLADEIHERTQGIPLFAVEELRQWRNPRDSRTRGRDLVDLRLSELTPEDRNLLQQASVIGERFAVRTLADLAELPVLEVTRQLDALAIRSGVVAADGPDFRFAHSRFREILLESMTPALQQAYRQQLARPLEELPAPLRAFHRIHGETTDDAATALIEQGNQARELMDWQDAIRFYQEGLFLAKRDPHFVPYTYRFLTSLGDLHLAFIGEPAVARGYYEAALRWASGSREKTYLQFRLAQLHIQESPLQAHERIGMVEELATGDDAEQVEGMVSSLQSIQAMRHYDLPRAMETARQALQLYEPPRDIQLRLREILLVSAGILHSVEEIHREVRAVDATRSSPDWTTVSTYRAIAQAFGEAGRPEALEYCRKAISLLEKMGQHRELAGVYHAAGRYSFVLGHYDEAREWLQKCQQISPLTDAYLFLCKTWLNGRPAAGLEWAAELLQAYIAQSLQNPSSTDERTGLLQRFGMAERIFRHRRKEREFIALLEDARRQLQQAGVRTRAIWYLGKAACLPPVSPVRDTTGWRWVPGSGENALERDGGFVLYTAPHCGTKQMNMPRFLHPVDGDFTLAAALDSAPTVIAELHRCRVRAGQGFPRAQAAGGGGLLLFKNRDNYLRLLVHTQAPGEVLCMLQREGEHFTLGRGLLADGPAHLRLERRGTTVRALAGTDGRHWHLCGQTDLPGWDTAEAGVYGECVIDGYPIVSRAVTRFTDIGLEIAAPRQRLEPPADALYPRPRYAPLAEFAEFVASDPKMLRLLRKLPDLAREDFPVLIAGETGTGKELVARALHRLSDRGREPFVPLNCASIAPEILERELFGHVRGAFTGAHETRGGLFEAADGGILFLDEIGEASIDMQAHLLRVVEEQAVRLVGDSRLRSIDVRLVTATNRDLLVNTRKGQFRKDLYFRLKGAQVTLPPLRERPGDIPLIAHHTLDRWNARRELHCPGFTRSAMEALLAHDWPGNVRELIHIVEQAASEARLTPIAPAHLAVQRGIPPSSEDEARKIALTLERTRGNISAAARRLGISRPTLYKKMKKYGVQREG